MLACTADDGGKLPSFCIFKRKTLRKENFPEGVIVRNREKRWMDKQLAQDCIKTVWRKQPGESEKSLLVLNSFCCPKTDKTKQHLRKFRITPVIIPGGMTKILQSLDESINKPMKCLLWKKWNDWMLNADRSFTKSGEGKPELSSVCQMHH